MEPETIVDVPAKVKSGGESSSIGLDRVPPASVGGLTLISMLVYFWLSGALFPADTAGTGMSSAQVTGMSLTYATTTAFMLASLFYMKRRSRSTLDKLVQTGGLSLEGAASCGRHDIAMGLGRNVAATIIGLFLGGVQVSWGPIIDRIAEPSLWMVLGIAIGNMLTWLSVVHVVFRRVLGSLDLLRVGRDSTQIDLLRLDTLLPYGRIGTLHFLMVVMALSLSAFQSLDAELRWVNYSAALAMGIPAGIGLLLLPMIGIRGNVREAKRQRLDGLDRAIQHANRDLEPDDLRYLSDLLHQREAIGRAREWPLDTTSFSRIAIYFVIPPLAWVGSALVEILIQSAL